MLIKIPFNYQGERTQSEYGIRTNGPDIDTLFLEIYLSDRIPVQQKIKTILLKKKKIHIKENNRYR